MNCHKCTDHAGKPNKMILVNEVAMPSSLSRNEDNNSGTIMGYKCWSCGTRLELEIQPAMTLDKTEFRPMNMTRTQPNDMARIIEVIKQVKADIELMISAGQGWKFITEKLNLNCHWKTVRKIHDGVHRNGREARGAEIRAEVVNNFSEITELKKQRVAIDTIITTLKLTASKSSLSRCYKQLADERGVDLGRRSRNINPGVKHNNFKQDNILFGRRMV